MTWLALLAAREGRPAGWAALGGIALGLALVGIAAALGLSGLALSSPISFELLRLAGTAYMLWLAWQTWRDGAENSPSRAGPSSAMRPFRAALTINLLNPKAATFFVVVLPGFVAPDRPAQPQLLALTAIYVAIASTVHALILLSASAAHGWIADATRSRWIGRVFAVLIALVALWMFAASARSG